MLMKFVGCATSMPMYMNKAAATTDPVERLKLVMTHNFCWMNYEHQFVKPLNPILGETYQCHGQDGTKFFVEQTSHHPPRSHFQADGPDGAWSMSGWLDIEIYSGPLSSSTVCNGWKVAKFADGGLIRWNPNNDKFTGIFMGIMNHQLTGKVTFHDEANDLTGFYEFGAYMWRKQDYVWGEMH